MNIILLVRFLGLLTYDLHCNNFFLVVPDGSKDLLRELPGIKDLEVTAKYPIAEGLIIKDEGENRMKTHIQTISAKKRD